MDSYEEILERMKKSYRELSGFEADDAADIGIRLKVLASEIFSCQSYDNWLSRQIFPQTAQGEALDNHAYLRGLERKHGVKARGTLVFRLSEPATEDIIIPMGTVCATNEKEPLCYETTQDCKIAAGLTSQYATAQAQQVGAKYNVLANKVTVFVTPPAGVDSVQNTIMFLGGTDEENDEDLRKRILDNIKNTPCAGNSAYYKKEAESVDGVYSAAVIPKNRGTGTVDVFIVGKGRTSTPAEIEAVSELLQQQREVNVDVGVYAATPVSVNVSVDVYVKPGYSFEEVSSACEVSIKKFFNSLQVGEEVRLCKLGDAIFHTEGLERYVIITPYDDMESTNNIIYVLGSLDFYRGT